MTRNKEYGETRIWKKVVEIYTGKNLRIVHSTYKLTPSLSMSTAEDVVFNSCRAPVYDIERTRSLAAVKVPCSVEGSNMIRTKEYAKYSLHRGRDHQTT
ncbi:unnamed protein product [Leptosia nina]|uniref:Uncharacterized protein n=1 Tax=Leptosia nina TaxID=320188 RepID=A0AAV1K5S9_9NEOP